MEAAGGVETPDTGPAAAIAIDFSAGEPCSSSPARVPKRIRRRLLECRNNRPLSAEEIEAKLKEADLRRKQFHEWLSSKARPKPRSPAWSSQEDDLGRRLEAKLNAAEKKRLSLLVKEQNRLTRLDELRKAAKAGVEMRFEKQREELVSRVEIRVRKADANRLHLLKDHMQRLAAVQERKARSMLQSIARENKYKEHIRLAILQKRCAAEKRRMMLLEEEKSRAQARVLQVRRVAKFICCQRENERKKMKEQLENRLLRAKRQRAEFQRLRGHLYGHAHVSWVKDGDILSRKLASCWKNFVRSRRTTFTLARAYEALGIHDIAVKSMPFEQLAHLIESDTTLETVKALLDRLESCFFIYLSSSISNPENIDHLLKHLVLPRTRTSPGKISRAVSREVSARASSSEAGKLSRYPERAVLCAYMIVAHPSAVFSEQGEREVDLSIAAVNLVHEFELLIKIILDSGNIVFMLKLPSPKVECDDSDNHDQFAAHVSSPRTFRNQLSSFDAAWCAYLSRFVVWKAKDAKLLEDDLVRAACQLELSMMQTCKQTSEGQTLNLSHDMRAIQKQVTEDQRLLRERVKHLSGNAGLERLESALVDTRSRFFEARDIGMPLVGHITQHSSPRYLVKPVDLASWEHSTEKSHGTDHIVHSLFVDTSLQPTHGASGPFLSSQSSSKLGGQLPSENELLVNEILHGSHSAAEDLDANSIDKNENQARVKETLEQAFWDSLRESMMEDYPDYDRIMGLVKEVRDELSEIAPRSWKQDIHDSIDVDILTQVMESGAQDGDYLGKILEYALLMLRKLSAPAYEDDLKKTHEKFLDGLFSTSQSNCQNKRSFIIALIKGLRFVMEQIQTLKKEISKTRIQMIEPIIKGSAGLEYLQKAFADRYGLPSSATDSLTLTNMWLSPLKNTADDEWNDYIDSLSMLPENHVLPPNMTLRTGGNISLFQKQSLPQADVSGGQQLECSGEKLDVLLRLGVLKLASRMEGVTADDIPETLKLNWLRLRSVQSKLQQIIVICTSMLVLRQFFITEHLSFSPSELDTITSNSVQNLFQLVDRSPDIGIDDIIDSIITSSSPAEERLRNRKEVMARVVLKSLQNDDAVFRKINRSVYLATRAILFGGTGPHAGRRLAEGILQKIGAAVLADKVVEAALVLIVMARVSLQVHEPWYRSLV